MESYIHFSYQKKKKNENRFFYMKDPRPYFQLGITSIFFNVYLFDLVS